jgi:TPP-dependent pyruvate/acetoin dehydrogenase alpha subunit
MPTMSKARTTAAAVAGKNGHSLISSEKFRELYSALVKCELLDQCLGLSSTGKNGGAGAVGITLDLEHEDTVILSPRTLAANGVKGAPLRGLLDHYENGHRANGLHFTAVNALTGTPSAVTQAGLAAGAALANKMAGNRKVAVAFIEGSAAALSECREALEVASANKLPVVYVIYASPDRQLEKALAEAAELVPVITVDADDVVAVYRVAQESIARARDGCASIIVCVPCPANGVPNNAVANMERYLTGKKLFRNHWRNQAIVEFEREMAAACVPPANPLA